MVVECQRPLARLLARCPGIDRLIPNGDPLPPCDVQAPLLSLPKSSGPHWRRCRPTSRTFSPMRC